MPSTFLTRIRTAPRRAWQIAARRAGVRRGRALPGLTFIEILVVLIILAAISGLIATQFIGEAERSKAKITQVQIESLRSALDLYRLHNSTYPSTEQGLSALLRRPEVGTIPESWQGPYLNSNVLPQDGWARDFEYRYDTATRRYTITSLGADGIEGGTDLDADISSDDL
jgi:general secretion pathway protein G